VIIAKFEPFYEFSRYPVQTIRPKAPYAYIYPDDIFILDYFVMRMKEYFSKSVNLLEFLKNGRFDLRICRENCKDFYDAFFIDNINFINCDPS
jgi:hypothetical protein